MTPDPPSSPEGAASLRSFYFARVCAGNSLFDDIQRLRYDVYCLECHFLDPARYPDARECDEFDALAVHFAGSNHKGEIVATLRLVPDSPLGFPLERFAHSLFPAFRNLDRAKTAEISRLVIARNYRRRAGDRLYGEVLSGENRSSYPLIMFGLFREMYEASAEMGLEGWLAAMEPSLQRHLNRFGLGLKEIGEPMQYYGEVVPYYSRIRDLEEFVASSRPDVFSFFR
jgi:N-acyl amino acid synthase of PEP-CTERM/exosortase system